MGTWHDDAAARVVGAPVDESVVADLSGRPRRRVEALATIVAFVVIWLSPAPQAALLLWLVLALAVGSAFPTTGILSRSGDDAVLVVRSTLLRRSRARVVARCRLDELERHDEGIVTDGYRAGGVSFRIGRRHRRRVDGWRTLVAA